MSIKQYVLASLLSIYMLMGHMDMLHAQVHTTQAQTPHTNAPKTTSTAPANTDTIIKAPMGVINITEDPGIDYIMRNFIMPNDLRKTTRGYRIQLISTTSRQLANDTKAHFVTQFPDVRVYIIYQQPYFKVRAGDFETEAEVQELYRRVHKLYNTSFPVNDNVNINK